MESERSDNWPLAKAKERAGEQCYLWKWDKPSLNRNETEERLRVDTTASSMGRHCPDNEDSLEEFVHNQMGPSTKTNADHRPFFWEIIVFSLIPLRDSVPFALELKLIVVVVPIVLSFPFLVELNVEDELDVDIPNIPKQD